MDNCVVFDRGYDTPCWIFIGALSGGYVPLSFKEKGCKASVLVGGHRFVWETVNRKRIPEGLFIRHLCGQSDCVRPEHLKPGTAKDNYDDSVIHGLMVRDMAQPS